MTHSRWRAPLAALLAFGLVLAAAACGDDSDTAGTSDTTTAANLPTIRIAPQDFAESKTLTEVYAQYLKAEGFKVDLQPASGFRDQVYPALENDKLDLIIDYTGSAAGFLNKDSARKADAAEAFAGLQTELATKDLVAFDYSKAQDANALVVLKSVAEDKGLTTISDLKKLGTVKLGGAEDCRNRTDCLKGYTDPTIYGLTIDFTALEYGPALTTALEENAVQAAQYQTTAPQLATGKFVALKDDKGLLSADNIVPVLRKELADAYGKKLQAAIDKISSTLTTDDLIAWNVSTDIDKDEPADVAKAWLTDKGLL